VAETVAAAAAGRRRARRAGVGELVQTYGALAGLVVLLLFNIAFTPDFLSLDVLRVNLTQVAMIVIVATGMTLVIATGGIDLSVGSLMAIAGALAPLIFLRDVVPFNVPVLGTALAFVLPVTLAAAFGLFNGALITRFGIQPIIATLVLFIAGRGFAQVLAGGKLQAFRDDEFQFIGRGEILGIPFQAVLMLVVVAVAAWAMRATTFGRYVLAVGGNEAAARLAGVPVNRVKLAVYTISGALAGLAGLIFIAINSSSDTSRVGLDMELAAIAAVAVGGTPLTGGRANVVGTFLGALILQLLTYTLLRHNVAREVALIVQAAIIVAAVMFQRERQA
jgi:simple sugar transport system permease protein/ribose transport system permease protein